LSSGASSDADWLLGVGLSRIMVRDLMLVPQLSVRGPEDTELAPLDVMPPGSPVARRHILIGGQVRRVDSGFTADLRVQFPDGEVVHRQVAARALQALIERCNCAAIAALGLSVVEENFEGWQAGRPGSLEALLEYARLAAAEDKLAGSRRAIAFWKTDR